MVVFISAGDWRAEQLQLQLASWPKNKWSTVSYDSLYDVWTLRCQDQHGGEPRASKTSSFRRLLLLERDAEPLVDSGDDVISEPARAAAFAQIAAHSRSIHHGTHRSHVHVAARISVPFM